MPIPKLLHISELTERTKSRGKEAGSPEFKTGIFFFPRQSLRDAKQAANNSIAGFKPGNWGSSGDVLTAILWSAVIEVEEGADLDPDVQGSSTIGLPVNIRPRLSPPLSKDYLGAAFVMPAATALWQDLLGFARTNKSTSDGGWGPAAVSSLIRIALSVRRSVDSIDRTTVWEVLAYLSSQVHIRSVVLGPHHDGISIVSWAD